MSITLASYSFASPTLHGTVQQMPWKVGKAIVKFFGVVGDYQLTGAKHDRMLIIDNIVWTGYASRNAAQSAVDAIATQQELDGTLTVDHGGGDTPSWTQAIFLGLDLQQSPRFDGSGVHGWMFRGRLQFRQQASA